MRERITVAENIKRLIGNNTYIGALINWYQLNRIAEDAWQNKDKLEFVGEDIAENGTMFCAFQELLHNANNSYRRGKIYFVDNDVVLDIQKNGDRIIRRRNNERP